MAEIEKEARIMAVLMSGYMFDTHDGIDRYTMHKSVHKRTELDEKTSFSSENRNFARFPKYALLLTR